MMSNHSARRILLLLLSLFPFPDLQEADAFYRRFAMSRNEDYSALGLTGKFNGTRCPAYWEMQSDRVKNSFDVLKLAGFYYELAEHDYTQYPACPTGMRCVSSEKVVDLERGL